MSFCLEQKSTNNIKYSSLYDTVVIVLKLTICLNIPTPVHTQYPQLFYNLTFCANLKNSTQTH